MKYQNLLHKDVFVLLDGRAYANQSVVSIGLEGRLIGEDDDKITLENVRSFKPEVTREYNKGYINKDYIIAILEKSERK